MPDHDFKPLLEYLSKVPSITGTIGVGVSTKDDWWVKFTIDIEHPLAWNVVQELAFVLNYASLDERLPTLLKPVSPPPYLNGGPEDFLSWVIECVSADFTPTACTDWLEGRLPRPVEDLNQWREEPEVDPKSDDQELCVGSTYP